MTGSLLFAGGRVIDGTGRPGFMADVSVSGGTVRLVRPGSGSAEQVIDVTGLVVAPGFIDAHSHADVANHLGEPSIDTARIAQGVTTEMVGNCGITCFPVDASNPDRASEFMSMVFGSAARPHEDLPSYAASVEAIGLPSNLAPLVGHGTLRAAALGYENRPASEPELDWMRNSLEQAMRDGAFGLSTGLCYTPATYAQTAEVVSLAAVVARYGGIYATHIRNETHLTFESLAEAVEVAELTGVDLHIAHLKLAGRPQWGRSSEVLDYLDGVRDRGVEVTADVYPYSAASTSLHSLLPPWTAEQGIDALHRHLGDPAWRDRVAEGLTNGVDGWQNLGSAAGWENVSIASAPGTPEVEGKTIAQLIEAGERPIDAISRVLAANPGKCVVVIDAMLEEDMTRFLGWAHTVIGSDGIPLPGRPHPRLTGTFPRALGRYRDQMGGLERAVERMTGATASRFGLVRRGVLADGNVADMVIFDPDDVVDRGTFQDPWQQPMGVEHVLIGGTPAVRDGTVTGDLSGRVLARGRP